jgi:hypothetical protein
VASFLAVRSKLVIFWSARQVLLCVSWGFHIVWLFLFPGSVFTGQAAVTVIWVPIAAVFFCANFSAARLCKVLDFSLGSSIPHRCVNRAARNFSTEDQDSVIFSQARSKIRLIFSAQVLSSGPIFFARNLPPLQERSDFCCSVSLQIPCARWLLRFSRRLFLLICAPGSESPVPESVFGSPIFSAPASAKISGFQAEVSFSLFFCVDPAQARVPHQGFIVLGLSYSIFARGVCGLLQEFILIYS